MKIKKVKPLNKIKLIKLQILKSKIYKKKKDLKISKKLDTNEIHLYLKKIIHIIYEFHCKKKKILFLNFPKKIIEKITNNLQKNQHIFTNNENLLNEVLSNQKINFTQPNNFSKTKIPLKKIIDLIVIYNPLTSLNLNKKLYVYNIPVITINNKIKLKLNYKLIGHFKFTEKQINNNLFFSILSSIFKHTNNNKQKTKL